MYPAGVIGKTADNLFAAAEGEKLEWGTLYPGLQESRKKRDFGSSRVFTKISIVSAFMKCATDS